MQLNSKEAIKQLKCELKNFKEIERNFTYSMLNYSFKSVVFRAIASSIMSLLVITLIVIVGDSFSTLNKIRVIDVIRVSTAFFFVSESQIVIDKILEYYFPLPYKVRLRTKLQVIFSILCIILAYQVLMYVSDDYSHVPRHVVVMGVSFALVFMSQFTGLIIIFRSTEKWMAFENEIEQLKKEKIESDYNSLQDQLNPHFLFNNLSVLKSLILYDTDTAAKFTDDFTDVYRYVLDSKNKQLVDLEDEITFIKSYIGLHKERLGDGLVVTYNFENNDLAKKIAPLTLQLLVENAIKHNITSKQKPLNISITVDKMHIAVVNNVQLKDTSYSTKTGLSNLKARYRIISKEEIEVKADEGLFTVAIPLL